MTVFTNVQVASGGRNGLGIVRGLLRGRDGKPMEAHVTSAFGTVRSGKPHTGSDLAGPVPGVVDGATLLSPAAGVVLDAFHMAIPSSEAWIANWKRVFGNSLIVRHGQHVALYAHLDSIAVTEGARVAAGAVLGRIGNTGQSTGAHLHWGLAVESENRWLQSTRPLLDPLKFIAAPAPTTPKPPPPGTPAAQKAQRAATLLKLSQAVDEVQGLLEVAIQQNAAS